MHLKMKNLKLIFYKLHYTIAVGGIIHAIAQINFSTEAKMPFDYTWSEKYLIRIEYLKRKSQGIECTFEDVEKEYLDEWHKNFEDAKKRFWEERSKHENGDDWWI